VATYTELQSEVDDLAGFDLTSTERNRLIAEAYSALVTDSEWLRVLASAGPTVAGTAAYALPTGTYRVLRLEVNRIPYEHTDERTAREFEAGSLYYRLPSGSGFYWLSNSSGTDQISLYPTPTTSGLSVYADVVKEPTELSGGSDVPVVPARFHRAIVEYVKWVAYRSLEDDLDAGADAKNEYDRYVAELRALRNSRGGRAPMRPRIVGIHTG
jgi:hypothetical protein